MLGPQGGAPGSGGGHERGFIESTNADVIRRSSVYDYQSVFQEVGDSVDMTGGSKQTQRDALVELVRQDSERDAVTFEEYFNNGNVIGERPAAGGGTHQPGGAGRVQDRANRP